MADRAGFIKWLLLGRSSGFRASARRQMWQCVTSRQQSDATDHAAGFSSDSSATTASESLTHLEPPRDVTPPDGYEVVLHKDALVDGEVTEVIAGGRAIALARVDGEFFAVSNECPHAGGPIGEGELSGHLVRCLYHGWEFDLRTGTCAVDEAVGLETYSVQLLSDAVCVQLN